MTPAQLQKILADHDAWLKNSSTGKRADLSGAELQGADLRRANLDKANLSGAQMDEADLTDASLEWAHLRGAHLNGAHLSGANLRRASLARVHLKRTNLQRVNLEGAYLQGAHLEEADLTDARLEGADLTGAHLEGAKLREANFSLSDLREVEGLRLDSSIVRQATFSPWAADPWSVLRRNYTGGKLLFHLLLLSVFILAYASKAMFWVGVNHAQETFDSVQSQIDTRLEGVTKELQAEVDRIQRESRIKITKLTDLAATVRERGHVRLQPCLSSKCAASPSSLGSSSPKT
jgi:hypothetical protein